MRPTWDATLKRFQVAGLVQVRDSMETDVDVERGCQEGKKKGGQDHCLILASPPLGNVSA